MDAEGSGLVVASPDHATGPGGLGCGEKMRKACHCKEL